jgi:hypothetical protein
MEAKLTEQESLQMITQIIHQAQNNFRKGTGNITIFWGFLVAFAALLCFAINLLLPDIQSAWVWLIVLPGWVVTYLMSRKIKRAAIVKTHIDRIFNSIWIAFTISIIFLQLVFWAAYYQFDIVPHFFMMTPITLLLTGVAQFTAGKAYRFQPYIYGGYIFGLGATVCLFILSQPSIHFLVLAVCMVFGCIIPGWKLNQKAEEDV